MHGCAMTKVPVFQGKKYAWAQSDSLLTPMESLQWNTKKYIDGSYYNRF